MSIISFRLAGLSLALTILCAVVAVPVSAQQQVIIGTPQGQNLFPFGVQANYNDSTGTYDFTGAYAGGGEYQEIYSGSDFANAVPGLVTINEIGFASSPLTTANAAIYDVTLRLSETSSAPSSPAADFQANKANAPDLTTVFSGNYVTTLSGSSTFDLIFPITPFRYDSSDGNLMLDVTINDPTIANGVVAFVSTAPDQTGRVYQPFGTGDARTKGSGLYTEFGVTPVPEVSTAAGLGILLCLGGLGLILAARRRPA